MFDEKIVIFGATLSFIGHLSYIIDTLKGKIKPNRVSWSLWSIVPMIAFFAEISKGVGLVSLMTFTVGFYPFLILLASFISKKAHWEITRFDLACGGISVLGIMLWLITADGNYAILFSIFADFAAALPTLTKSYHYPETENYIVFLFAAINALITLFAIRNWNIANFGFPLYILSLNSILVFLIKFKPGKSIAIE